MNTERIVSAVTMLVAAPLLVSGCVASTDRAAEEIPAAVVASDPDIRDSHISFSTGPAGVGFWLRIYVDDTSDAVVARALTSALDAAYAAAPSQPTDIQIDVAATPKPDDVELSTGSIPIAAAAEIAGLDDYLLNNSIALGSAELEDRYGAWGEEG